jgi:hypothetical protein
MSAQHEEHPDKDALPGEVADNGEEQAPTQPTKRKPTEHERGGGASGGEAGEGSQSTGNPDSAG